MTEYMPTTEEVRRCYGDIHCSDLDAGSLEHHVCLEEADFNLWLNEIRAEAWEEGFTSGLDAGITIAGIVHENVEALDLENLRGPEKNPYRPNEK